MDKLTGDNDQVLVITQDTVVSHRKLQNRDNVFVLNFKSKEEADEKCITNIGESGKMPLGTEMGLPFVENL